MRIVRNNLSPLFFGCHVLGEPFINSHLRFTTTIPSGLGFVGITSLGSCLLIKTLTRHVIDATLTAMGREIALDWGFLRTQTILLRFHSGAMGLRRSFRAGMRNRRETDQRDHGQCLQPKGKSVPAWYRQILHIPQCKIRLVLLRTYRTARLSMHTSQLLFSIGEDIISCFDQRPGWHEFHSIHRLSTV